MTIDLACFLDRGDSLFDDPEYVAADAIRLAAKAEGEDWEMNNLSLQLKAVRLMEVLYPMQPSWQLQHHVHTAFEEMVSSANQSIQEACKAAAV